MAVLIGDINPRLVHPPPPQASNRCLINKAHANAHGSLPRQSNSALSHHLPLDPTRGRDLLTNPITALCLLPYYRCEPSVAAPLVGNIATRCWSAKPRSGQVRACISGSCVLNCFRTISVWRHRQHSVAISKGITTAHPKKSVNNTAEGRSSMHNTKQICSYRYQNPPSNFFVSPNHTFLGSGAWPTRFVHDYKRGSRSHPSSPEYLHSIDEFGRFQVSKRPHFRMCIQPYSKDQNPQSKHEPMPTNTCPLGNHNVPPSVSVHVHERDTSFLRPPLDIQNSHGLYCHKDVLMTFTDSISYHSEGPRPTTNLSLLVLFAGFVFVCACWIAPVRPRSRFTSLSKTKAWSKATCRRGLGMPFLTALHILHQWLSSTTFDGAYGGLFKLRCITEQIPRLLPTVTASSGGRRGLFQLRCRAACRCNYKLSNHHDRINAPASIGTITIGRISRLDIGFALSSVTGIRATSWLHTGRVTISDQGACSSSSRSSISCCSVSSSTKSPDHDSKPPTPTTEFLSAGVSVHLSHHHPTSATGGCRGGLFKLRCSTPHHCKHNSASGNGAWSSSSRSSISCCSVSSSTKSLSPEASPLILNPATAASDCGRGGLFKFRCSAVQRYYQANAETDSTICNFVFAFQFASCTISSSIFAACGGGRGGLFKLRCSAARHCQNSTAPNLLHGPTALPISEATPFRLTTADGRSPKRTKGFGSVPIVVRKWNTFSNFSCAGTSAVALAGLRSVRSASHSPPPKGRDLIGNCVRPEVLDAIAGSGHSVALLFLRLHSLEATVVLQPRPQGKRVRRDMFSPSRASPVTSTGVQWDTPPNLATSGKPPTQDHRSPTFAGSHMSRSQGSRPNPMALKNQGQKLQRSTLMAPILPILRSKRFPSLPLKRQLMSHRNPQWSLQQLQP